jgi:murein DD-endopeptidase MepM/ murein hydrolase activator NlpD
MKKILNVLRRELNRGLTFMVIPHNTIKPLRLSFSLSFILFIIFMWTGLTLWAGYIASQHIDYWRVKSDNSLMKLKVVFFAQQVKKSREMLDQMKENDQNIRTLLDLKSKKAIIENEGQGGPSPVDANILTKALDGKLYEMSQVEIFNQTSALWQEAKQQIDSYREIVNFVHNQRAIYKAVPNCWPCVGKITAGFGYREHPIFHYQEFHAGVDIANEKSTPVYATGYGTIKMCDWQSGYGRLIVLDHGYGYQTFYGHLSKILVNQGDKIKRGQLIGLMGNTGTSTGNHLHYEIRYGQSPINPVPFLKKDIFAVTNLLTKR